MLKHGGASEKALELARGLQCDFCLAQARPKVPLPGEVKPAHSVQSVPRVGCEISSRLEIWTKDESPESGRSSIMFPSDDTFS